MKKETLIYSLILLLGIIFEGIYLTTESTFFGVKFYLLATVCILVGVLGLWVYTVMPFINGKLENRNKKN